MKRYLEDHILEDLKTKAVLLSGPRQVGKTTLSKQLGISYAYLNYDAAEDRSILRAKEWDRMKKLIIFDELHKMKNWKSWLKGIIDKEEIPPYLLITGSARMDTFRKGGESLAGRHFYYRLHPLDVKEASGFMNSKEALDLILKVGGFPEPFIKGSEAYARRWRKQHTDIIIRQDLIDLEKVREIKNIEILVELLKGRVGSTISYKSLAEDIQVSIPTIKHWLEILEKMFIIFSVRPYHKNIARAILKEPKYYFFDNGSVIGNISAVLENAVACSLIKYLHFLEDTGGYRTSLHYIRDKEKREVDFLTVIDGKVKHIIEVKLSNDQFSKHLIYFSKYFDDKTDKIQIVYNLRQSKMKGDIRMISVNEFLATL